MQSYLQPTQFFDYQHPSVKAYAEEIIAGEKLTATEIAVKFYYAVRDDILYNPYVFSFEPHTLSASHCLLTKESYCIPKAVLLGAMARYQGIPSRLGLADVKNHLSSQKLLDYLRSDIFVMHGYIELYLNDKWVKATPAFNLALCEKTNVHPLEFDGKTDSIFQEHNQKGIQHMEYVNEHGTFDDVPLEFIQKSVICAYPHLTKDAMHKVFDGHSLDKEFDAETKYRSQP